MLKTRRSVSKAELQRVSYQTKEKRNEEEEIFGRL